jgi:phosphatidylglycerol:prolipoprotein diacylglycerol transferase
MATTALFCIGYGSFRFMIEFVRVPDAHLGYIAWDWLTMGQILTLPLIITGLVLIWLMRKESRN